MGGGARGWFEFQAGKELVLLRHLFSPEIQTTPIPLWSPSCLDCVRWFCLGLIVSLFYVSPFPLVMHPRLNSQRPQLLEMRPRLTKNGLVVVGHQS